MSTQTKVVYVVLAMLMVISVASYSQAAWIHAKAVFAQQLLQSAWQESLLTGKPVRPWPWADTWPIAKLSVPSKNIDMVILEGGNGASLPFGPGHITSSALPGEEGISMLVAHRDTHFSFLAELNMNNRLLVTRTDKRVASYKVSSVNIIDTRKEEVRSKSMNSQLILVTCYPFDAVQAGTPYRYVITADAVTTPTLTRM